MANKYLAHEDAPFGAETWEVLNRTMVEVARNVLAGRRLLDVEGPYGLGLKVVPVRDRSLEGSGMVVSDVLPVVLIQRAFTLGTRDLAGFERNRLGFDTGPVAEAARDVAHMEDDLVFNGAAGVPGLLTVQNSNVLNLTAWDTVGTAANEVIQAVTVLDRAGFHGPYALALAPQRYNLLFRRYEQGGAQTELDHVRTIVTDGVVKAPGLETGGVLLASGPQFASIVLGQDMSIRFIGPADGDLEFSIFESLTLRILQPRAIAVLSG